MVLGAVTTPSLPESEFRRFTLHEFGHALGLLHEFQNPNGDFEWDIPAATAYFRQLQGWSEEMTKTFVLPLSPEKFGTKPFDARSIMMYSFPRALLKRGWSEAWDKLNSELSPGDKRYIGSLYPFNTEPITLQIPITNTADRPGPLSPARFQPIERLKLDRFQFRASRPGRYVVETKSAVGGLEVYLFGPNDEITQIKENDPTRPAESRVEADLQPGTYVIKARHLKKTNAESYTIQVGFVGPPVK